jgi:hypothetical protein
MKIELVPAELGHALIVARGLRAAAKSHFTTHGDTKRALWATVQKSSYAVALLIDGRCAGIGGEVGSPLDEIGFVWAAGTITGLRHRFLIARLVKREVLMLLEKRAGLCCRLLALDRVGIRFAEFLGFTFGPEHEEFGILVRDGTLSGLMDKAA